MFVGILHCFLYKSSRGLYTVKLTREFLHVYLLLIAERIFKVLNECRGNFPLACEFRGNFTHVYCTVGISYKFTNSEKISCMFTCGKGISYTRVRTMGISYMLTNEGISYMLTCGKGFPTCLLQVPRDFRTRLRVPRGFRTFYQELRVIRKNYIHKTR